MNPIENIMALADRYAERYHDYQVRASYETAHDMDVFSNALRTAIEQAMGQGDVPEALFKWANAPELVETGNDWQQGYEYARAWVHVQLSCNNVAPQPQPEQEPVAWMDERGRIYRHCTHEAERANGLPLSVPLYTTPQPQQWVGLTDEEIIEWVESGEYNVITNDWASHIEFTRAIEAKLREKNGGGRDWSLLEATQDSLREHMAMIHRDTALLQQALVYLERSVDNYPTGQALSRSCHEDTIAALKERLK
jgi:exonuclease VII small subunit